MSDFDPYREKNDAAFTNTLKSLYGDVLSARGINLEDPIKAHMFYYNKIKSTINAGYPLVNKVITFFTRPELNFSYENINAVPFFKWVHGTSIGRMCMASLTDPDFGINLPSSYNAGINHEQIYNQLVKLETLGRTNNAYEAGSVKSLADIEAENAADLNKIDIASLSAHVSNASSIKNAFSSMDAQYNAIQNELASITSRANGTGNGLDLSSADDILTFTRASNIMGDGVKFTSPFIPVLQNSITSMTGGSKDFNLEQFSYEPDYFGSNFVVPTGMDEIWGSGTFNTTHDDILYGPSSMMFMLWVMYIHYVSRGYIASTRDHVINRILDFTCSAYMYVIGHDGRTIERFGKFTGCYPNTFPFSSQLEFAETINSEMLRKLSITWTYNRFEPMDPRVLTDFNFVSQTEWLYKLKNWGPGYYSSNGEENHIQIGENGATTNKANVFKNSTPDKVIKSNVVNTWDKITKAEDRGCSGKIPEEIIDGTGTFKNKATNHWGGYPYINKGRELIYVLPKDS